MTTLPAWSIEHARAHRQSKNFDEAPGFSPVALRRENGSVLKEVLRIEIAFPPLRRTTQKNTGSR